MQMTKKSEGYSPKYVEMLKLACELGKVSRVQFTKLTQSARKRLMEDAELVLRLRYQIKKEDLS
jgi:hypothetical protein